MRWTRRAAGFTVVTCRASHPSRRPLSARARRAASALAAGRPGLGDPCHPHPVSAPTAPLIVRCRKNTPSGVRNGKIIAITGFCVVPLGTVRNSQPSRLAPTFHSRVLRTLTPRYEAVVVCRLLRDPISGASCLNRCLPNSPNRIPRTTRASASRCSSLTGTLPRTASSIPTSSASVPPPATGVCSAWTRAEAALTTRALHIRAHPSVTGRTRGPEALIHRGGFSSPQFCPFSSNIVSNVGKLMHENPR